MNTNLKKGLLIFGIGTLVFLILKKVKPAGNKKSKSQPVSRPITDEQRKNAAIAITAYQAAMQAGESKEFLDEMNLEFAKEFKLKVFTDRGSGKQFAATLDGTKIA